MIKLFKTQKEVNEYFSHNKIQCLICGKWFKSLAAHIAMKHGINVREYKDKFNLPLTQSLSCKNTRKKSRDALIKRIASGDSGLMDIQEVGHLGQQIIPTFRNYTKENYSKHMKKVNKKRIANITMNRPMEMEQYVCYLEKHSLCPYHILHEEKSLGLITYSTFRRSYNKSPKQYKHLYVRIRSISSKKIYTRDQRIAMQKIIKHLRAKNKTICQIAEDTLIPESTIKNILQELNND